MEKDRITKAGLKNHWRYNWWKYVLMAALVLMSMEMIFAMTAYRPPADKSITMYVCHSGAATDAMQEDLWPVMHEAYPEQEQLTVQNINLSTDDIYAQMQFSTYIAARQGDILFLEFSYADQMLVDEGEEYTFIDLTPYVERGDIVLSEGAVCLTRTRADGSIGIFGVPTDGMTGLAQFSCKDEGAVMCIMNFSVNVDTAAGLIGIMQERYQ